jgi:putative ABC transport system permease protein
MFNTMTVTLLERTEEIGIMKSIGAYDSNILSMFVAESTVMGFLGGVSGVIIAFIEGKIFNFGVNMVATYFGGQKADLFYTPLWLFASIILSAGVVGFLTGIIPAKRASSIDPLEALRYK